MTDIRSNLISQIEESSCPVPPDLASALSPAIVCLEEWKDYWLEIPEADSLRVGNAHVAPIRGEVFRLRFENRLGLAHIQPLADGTPLCAPITVEVISPKFPTPQQHLRFFRALLEDLFARSARLPFHLTGPTERGVSEALQPPTPLFMLHFLSQYAPNLRSALAQVRARPYRSLTERTEQVPLAEASQADAAVLQDIVRSPERWAKTERDFVVTRCLDGYAPATIRQSLPRETLDTPENRFVHHFLRQLLVAGENLLTQQWWPKVPAKRQDVVRAVVELARRAYYHPMCLVLEGCGADRLVMLESAREYLAKAHPELEVTPCK